MGVMLGLNVPLKNLLPQSAAVLKHFVWIMQVRVCAFPLYAPEGISPDLNPAETRAGMRQVPTSSSLPGYLSKCSVFPILCRFHIHVRTIEFILAHFLTSLCNHQYPQSEHSSQSSWPSINVDLDGFIMILWWKPFSLIKGHVSGVDFRDLLS